MGGPMRMNPPRGMGGMGPQVGAGSPPPLHLLSWWLTSALRLDVSLEALASADCSSRSFRSSRSPPPPATLCALVAGSHPENRRRHTKSFLFLSQVMWETLEQQCPSELASFYASRCSAASHRHTQTHTRSPSARPPARALSPCPSLPVCATLAS